MLTARRTDRLELLATELRAATGAIVKVIGCDLEAPDAPELLLQAIGAEGIALDTLVNNAGFGLRGPFAALPADRQMAMIDLNVNALTALCRLVLPGLIERRAGGILNVASTAAFQPGPHMAVYYATKAYVLSLSEALHEEAKPWGVTVTALCPGPTATEFSSVADLMAVKAFDLGTMSAAEVAHAGYEGYRAGRALVIPGRRNKLLAFGSRLVPRIVARRVVGKLHGPKS